MSEKKKSVFTAPSAKNTKLKRPTTVTVASSKTPKDGRKEEKPGPKSRSKPPSVTSDMDMTMSASSNYDDDYRQIAYGQFLRSLLKDCVVDEKIERQTTEIDVQMSQLAARFESSVELLDKTNRRLKDINFACEHKRLLDLKSNDCSQFYEKTENMNAEELLRDLTAKEEECLDRLDTKNIDFGYDRESGHRQLLDAVNEAINGFEEIKKQSKLDIDKFKEYESSENLLANIERDAMELESLKREFEMKFPKFSEKIMKESSMLISKLMESDVEDDVEM